MSLGAKHYDLRYYVVYATRYELELNVPSNGKAHLNY